MEKVEVEIILRCQQAKYVKQLWRTMTAYVKSDYSYQYIAQKCEELSIKGHLVRWKRSKFVYYRATKQAIQEAVKLMNERGERVQKEAEALKMMMNNKRITNFV